VELFVGTYKSTDNWMLQARLGTINTHHRTLVVASAAYPEMQQRDKYQEAIDWVRNDADKLEAALEYRRKALFDSTGNGMTHEENPAVPKLNPHAEHVTHFRYNVYLKRFQQDEERFFTINEEGNEWEAKKMAEANKILKAPPLNKTRGWKPPPRLKAVLTWLRSSAEVGVM
jgi:hypothetical protein